MATTPDFKFDPRSPTQGIPLRYILQIKRTQVEMMSDRGYKPHPDDETVLGLNFDDYKQYLDDIAPLKFNEKLSGTYELKDGVEERLVNDNLVGRRALVFYLPIKFNKTNNVSPVGKEISKLVLSSLQFQVTTLKDKLRVEFNPTVYDFVQRRLSKYDAKKKVTKSNFMVRNRIVRYTLPLKSKVAQYVTQIYQQNERQPLIRHIILITYAEFKSEAINVLVNNQPNYHFEFFNYNQLSFNVTKHVLANQYTLLQRRQWKDIQQKNPKLNKNVIKKIYVTDAVNKYYGGVKDDVYLEKNLNMIPGATTTAKYTNYDYRVVIAKFN